MKSAEQWFKELGSQDMWGPDEVRKIQADALEHAAVECDRRRTAIKHPAYNTGCDECAVFIRAEAERLAG